MGSTSTKRGQARRTAAAAASHVHAATGWQRHCRWRSAARRTTLDLDRAGRVTAVNAHGWSERYAYDPAGNIVRTTASDPASQDTSLSAAVGDRDYTGTILRRAGRTTYEHDAQGG